VAAPDPDGIGIGSFTCTFGELECQPADIPGFAELWRKVLPGTEFATMGCGRFRKMAKPIGGYVTDCVERVLAGHGVAAADVDRLIVATSDACLARLGRDLAVNVMSSVGLTRCIPASLSFQQCCSSLEALRYGWELFADPGVHNVVLVALDFTPDDAERIRPYALFSDAVAGCLISRRPAPGSLSLLGSALTVDYAGLTGSDSFGSRQQAAQVALDKVFGATGEKLPEVTKVFGPNLYRPVALFNAMAAGVPKPQLHFGEPMERYGHCGNADWIINLVDYAGQHGLAAGELYLAHATAPGFFACGLLRGQ
jgi:3-oxoacyl-[acyl-carrier-protein] synthase III